MAQRAETRASSSTKLTNGLARVLGIHLDAERPYDPTITRGESIYSLSDSADAYIDPEPTVAEFFKELAPTSGGIAHYFLSLCPFLSWMPR